MFLFSPLSQNGIVQKDLTRLKMLLTEIEVSVCGLNDSGLPASAAMKNLPPFGFFDKNLVTLESPVHLLPVLGPIQTWEEHSSLKCIV